MPGVILVVVFTAGLLGLLVWIIIKSTQLKTVSGSEGLIGKTGLAVGDFIRGRGQVHLHGEIWQAESKDSILKQDPVEVTAVKDLVVTVKKID